MNQQPDINFEGVEQRPLREFAQEAYLNYSMYVIMDRALPYIGDGLKPVQRRIIYAMSELGLSSSAKYKKSARTVGDVLGKYHPHGDSACYEAMVLMAQPFSYRYPLVDGQGNWGAPDDPKSFAAMRYTEAKLSPFADVLLGELGQGTVEWQPNFDGSMNEPKMLPSRLPHILLNGITGIAVGMATDIPPHNTREVANAAIHLIDHPHATLEEVMNFIQAPDYPTEAEIISQPKEIAQIYKQGKGSIRMRAVWSKEAEDIVITALPHQVSGAKLLEQIANQMRAKKLPMVEDLRDESDHEHPTRIVITPRSKRVDCEQLMSHLFASTDLEKSYRVNLNMIGLDNRPAVKGLLTILNEWIQYRQTTVRRRLQYRLDKVLARLHILEGLLIAYLNLDEVIEIIRTEDEPKSVLMARFGLSPIQADAILDTKLRQLAKLEEMKIRGEQNDLANEQDGLETLLGDEEKLNELIKTELEEDAKKYGDDRRSPLIERSISKALTQQELMPTESITVVLSKKGWIRQAKGHDVDPDKLNYKSGDKYFAHAQGKSNQKTILVGDDGRSYTLDSHILPSSRTQGEPITGKLNLQPNSKIAQMCMTDQNGYWLISNNEGYGFLCASQDLQSKNKNGKSLVTLANDAKLNPLVRLEIAQDNTEELSKWDVICITTEGRLLVFSLTELPILSKGKGNKLIQLPKGSDDKMLQIAVVEAGSTVVLHSGKRKLQLKTQELDNFRANRGRRGVLLPRGLQNVRLIETLK